MEDLTGETSWGNVTGWVFILPASCNVTTILNQISKQLPACQSTAARLICAEIGEKKVIATDICIAKGTPTKNQLQSLKNNRNKNGSKLEEDTADV